MLYLCQVTKWRKLQKTTKTTFLWNRKILGVAGTPSFSKAAPEKPRTLRQVKSEEGHTPGSPMAWGWRLPRPHLYCTSESLRAVRSHSKVGKRKATAVWRVHPTWPTRSRVTIYSSHIFPSLTSENSPTEEATGNPSSSPTLLPLPRFRDPK